MKKILSVTLLAIALCSASNASVVGHNGKYFHVTESDKSYKVGRESIDGTLRNVHRDNLTAFMRRGRITAHKTNDGSYVLRGHINGVGGGPLLAGFAYWCTKSLCWGGVAAAGTAVVATGVGAGVALAGGGGAALTGGAVAGGVAKVGIGVGVKAVVGSTVAATGGAAVVASGLGATATGTAIATTGTVATVVATSGTTLGFIGTIEALALAAYAGALALPTP